ncbi:hypothetical protein GCM10022408_14820 [Hymenobacter fastidiosus]|uniref:Uncharacterized protein n=1 Tax=Hymenobacter fastidiosus TaxID=486264 RepID=A0ABP7RYQ1_9BACT
MTYCRAVVSALRNPLLAAFLLVAGPCVGQGPAAFVPPTSYDKNTRDPTLRYEPGGRPASFRGLDGAWHPVQIADWLTDRVYLNETGDYYRAFSPEDMTAFVDKYADTIVTVTGLAPGKLGRFSAVFGRQKFRGAGMQLVDVTDEARSILDLIIMPHRLVIRKNADGWLLVPRQKVAFQQLMLVLLADDPTAVAELQTGRVGRGQLPRLLTRYADFRTTQFLQTAARPRP